jgi:PKD repeat protein
MNKRCLMPILNLAICLALVFSFAGATAADDGNRTYPIMHPDEQTREQWIEAYNSAPLAHTETQVQGLRALGFGGSMDLLSHLEYTASERDQGTCGNCWAWAGTGVLEIALDVQEATKDRLSVQYINSCKTGAYACCGGWLSDVADFYTSNRQAIPWSNTNAYWQDGSRRCSDNFSTVGCGSVFTAPNYTIAGIDEVTVPTHGVTQATAIANIKSVLNQDKAVWFGFFLPTAAAWNDLFNFWSNSDESVVYDIDKFCNTTYVPGGGGHSVLCVGYNDDDPGNSYWIMLNSWGTTTSRPNGLFRVNMDMNYSGKNPGLGGGDNYSFYWQTLDVVFNVTVSIDAPDTVFEGSDFVARANVTEVMDLDTYQFNVTYNPDVLQVTDVTAGMIDSTPVPIHTWGFQPPATQGKVVVMGDVGGVGGATGSGYLAEIHFHVVGWAGDSSNITFSSGKLFNTSGSPGPEGEIPVSAWLGDSVQVTAGATVSIEAPADVVAGGNFTARVNTSQLTDFDSYALNISYNPSVIEVIGAEGGPEGVTAGMIDSTTVPVDSWGFSPPGTPGTISLAGDIPGGAGASGSGYLAEVHFHVTGSPGESSNISPFGANLTDNTGAEIPVWGLLGDSVQVIAGPTVSILAPAEADHCSNITVSVNVSAVTNFDSYELDISYNASVLEVVGAESGPQGVTAGMIDSTTVPVDSWAFFPLGTPGTIRVLGNIPGSAGATGSGYLAQLHFHVIGFPGDSSDITPSNGSLWDNTGEDIPVVDWLGASLEVSPGVVVSIAAPPEVAEDSNITARVNITGVTDLDSYQFELSYNTSVLEVIGTEGGPQGVTDGLIDSTPITDHPWMFSPLHTPGTLYILGNVGGVLGANGDGYLCEVHFHVIGAACNTSNLAFSDGHLYDTSGRPGPEGEIPVAAWVDGSVHVSSLSPLSADFSADSGIAGFPTEGYAGVTAFNFSDESSGGQLPYTAWDWDFGDSAGNSTLQNPVYTYAVNGSYNVALTVTDSLLNSDTETKVGYVTVYDVLDAGFSADSGIVRAYPDPATDPPVAYPTSGYVNATAFNFSDESSGGKLPYTAWDWDFGDGVGNSTLQNPAYSYVVNGTYPVALTVTDSLMDSDSETKIEYVMAYKPGDANANGSIDMGDVTKVERIVLRIDPPTIWADANQNGAIDMADATMIEWLILEID